MLFRSKNNKIEVNGKKVSVRPEHIRVSSTQPTEARSFSGTLKDLIFVGANNRYLVDTSIGMITALQADSDLSVGDSVWVSWSQTKEFSEPNR